jgi:hypothetical protein
MTTTPQEPGENAQTLAHSEGDPDPLEQRDSGGSDVGGPARSSVSSTEDSLTAPSDIGDDEPDSQSRNPL